MLPVALLSGGMAVRMMPYTEHKPKAMLIVDGKPFIEHQLSLLGKRGIERVVLCVGHMGKAIEDFVGDGSRFHLEARYSYDGNTLLGTGGAIMKALKYLSDPFFVMYGDSYLDIDYNSVEDAYRNTELPYKGLMTVYRNEDKWDMSNALFEGGRVLAYSKKSGASKMKHIDFGLGILSKQVFLPYQEYQERR